MSRFNKNGQNLHGEAEDAWLEANTIPSPTEERAAKPEPAPVTTPKPDEGNSSDKQQQKRKLNGGGRRNKKGENDG